MNNLYPLKGLQGRVDTEISAKPAESFGISPSILSSKIINDEYTFVFNNMCFNGQPVRGFLKVNQDVLKKKLNSWIKPNDRKYIKLEDYSNQKSKFVFDIDAWLDDGLKSCSVSNNLLTMSKTYRLAKALPYMVSVYGLEIDYGKYIAEHFKKSLKKYPELRKNVFGIIEDISKKHLNIDSISMFEYTYSRLNNSVTVKIKPVYVASIMGAMTVLNKDDSWKKKINFDKTVGMFLKFK